MAAVDHRSLPELVYHRLLSEILDARRPAGEKLTEESVCCDLGVSRTPAREALLMLHRDGLVDRFPRRGCFVKTFDSKDAVELFECRRIVEVHALELGFDEIPDEELAKLEKSLLGRDGKDRKKSLEIDDRLHALIVAACPNRHLREVAHQLLRKTYPFRLMRTFQSRKVSEISGERLRLIRAIRAGKKSEALRLLGEHIGAGKRLMETLPAGT